jgi:SAM-dependent methyltransferase
MDINIVIFLLIVRIILLLFSITILIFVSTHLFFWIFTGVPFLKSEKEILEKLEKEIDWRKIKRFYDLGSGNGNVLKFFAKLHPEIEFIGYELNPLRILISKLFCSLPNVKFKRKNIFKADYSDADIIFVFLLPEILEKIIKKFRRELKPHTLIISNSFQFPDDFPFFKKLGNGEEFKTTYFYEI